MNKFRIYILVILAGVLISISACQKDDHELGDLVSPSNLTLTYEIVGVDAANPNGDGSGEVHFTANADNEITFNYEFGDGKNNQIAADGKTTHVFSVPGTNTFNVTVYAIGTGGITSSKTAQVTVFSNFTDDEALQFLTGGSTKSWYWAADQTGHLGLGPNNFDYEPGSHTWPQWYQAAPWEKSSTSLYDCEFVFSIESGNLTFEQLNPTGEAFIQGLYAQELGLGEEGSYPFDIAGVKNVFFSPSNSIATIDGDYRGTTMSYSDGGFMGFYAGTSEYEIIEITENILKVRLVQANEPLFAWYHIFTNVNPEQK